MKPDAPIWYPYTQEAIAPDPLPVASAKDEFLILEDGTELIDGISSWWTVSHGHAQESILKAIYEQGKKLDHVIFAGFTHKPAEEVARKVLHFLPDSHKKIFFSDNGSTAVEIALKMAIQYFYNQGIKKHKVIAVEGAFHGETFGAMSISSRHGFDDAFVPYMFEVIRVPRPSADSLEKIMAIIDKENQNGEVAAFIYEPLIMGAGGMLMYDAQSLDETVAHVKKEGILTIADEVMTGFGRTGKIFATDHCKEKPDITCMAKGLSGGILPLALTSCEEKIYKAFYSQDKRKALYHGHSFTGNPIACAAASASLDIMASPEFTARLEKLTQSQSEMAQKIKSRFPNVQARCCGTVLAMDFEVSKDGYFSDIKTQLSNFFLENNVLLRPLGNVLYFMPTYCISETSVQKVHNLIWEALEKFNGK